MPTTDATSGRTAPREHSADAEPLTEGSVPDKETIEDVPTQRGRTHPTPFGSGEPGEPETYEQGMVRTGRAHVSHPDGSDTAGLTPDETAKREQKSRDNRAMVAADEQAEGHKATPTDAPPKNKSASRS